jgi:hypothetical protein
MNQSNFSVLSWNVRGLGDDDKCKDILSELFTIKPSVALLQESKLELLPVVKINSFLPRSLDQKAFLPAVGSAGGIISAVNSHSLTLTNHTHGLFSTSLNLSCPVSGTNIIISNIYAPSQRSLKADFLLEIRQIAPTSSTPWLLIGDFNLIRFACEKNKNNFHSSEAHMFNTAISDLQLIELPLLDRTFT